MSPQQAAPGDTVTVSGSGFPPGSQVEAELFSDPVLLGTATVGADGTFRLVVTVPTDTAPGFHTLRVRVVGGTVQAETTLVVTGPVVPIPFTTAGLSRTGSDIERPARLALALVVLGTAMVGLAWKGGGYLPALSGGPRWPRRRAPWRPAPWRRGPWHRGPGR